jgi:hypothetical protein
MKYTSSSASIQDKIIALKSAVDTFNLSVSSQYSMPPKYSNSLLTLSNRLKYLAGQSSVLEPEDPVQNWENLTNNLPNNLKFY